MSTSLKGFNIAVSFFTETNLAAIFLLRTERFVVFEPLDPVGEELYPIAGTEAVSASFFMILPSLPEPETCEASIPLPSNTLFAAGAGLPVS